MSEFRVDLINPPHGVYFPGMMVTGTVVCNTGEPKDYKQIVVELNGGANVSWTRESSGGGGSIQVTVYSSREKYISCMAVLWDKAVNGSLPAGNHRFDFSLELAGDRLPASFTSQSKPPLGTIKYTLEARIKKGVLQRDTTAVTTVTVGNIVTINSPQLVVPLTKELSKKLCCLCCASGPIVVTARIPHQGYCIGCDSIPVEVTIENGSNRNIQQILVLLKKHVVYTAQGYHNYEGQIIHTTHMRAIASHETAVLHPNPIPIPLNVIPSLQNCGILTVDYYVIVSAYIPCATKTSVFLPIVIGNVPLEGANTLLLGANYEPPFPTNPAPNYPSPTRD